MQRLKIPAPQEKQKQFLLAKKKHIGFGGARGGGKSWAVRTKAKLLALRYAGIRLLIVRRTYPELINNHIGILRTELLGIAKYNDKDKVLKFHNGSSIHFAYCAKDADLDRLQGVEYDVIFLDEATQLSEFQMKAIIACLRGVNAFPKRVYYTCNPGGQGHAYIKRIFIDRKYDEGEDPEDYEFIQSRVTDNAALLQAQPDYAKQLEALPQKLRRAWLEGDWNVFEGQFFEDFFDRPEHYADRQWTHALQFFTAGMFDPRAAEQALACLDMMDFDRKDFVAQRIAANAESYRQQQLSLLTRAGGGDAPEETPEPTGGGLSGAGAEGLAALGGKAERPVIKKAKQRVADSTAP